MTPYFLRPFSARCLAYVIAGLAEIAIAGVANATPLSWNNAAGGSAALSSNWNPQQTPAPADDLTFNLNNTYTVSYNATVPSSRSHLYKRGAVTLNVTSPHTVTNPSIIADTSGDVATMTLTTGTLTCNATVTVGDDAGSSGTLNVNDFDADLIITGATSDLIVGNNGDAAMNITGRGHIQVPDQFIAGSNSASTPTILISGAQATPPFGASFLEVLGTSQSRIGAGGDVTMTISNGGVGDFAGSLVIANGSASVSSVTVETAVLFNARLQVGGDLLVGRNTSAAVAAGIGTLTINTGGTTTVGGNTSLGDPDGGTGTIVMGGGTFNSTLPVTMQTGSAITGFGTVNANVTVGAGSIVATTTNGLTMGGIINNTGAGVSGSRINFGPTGGYTGSGSCTTEITGDPTAVITATGTLSLGKSVTSGINYHGILDVGAQSVTLVDSNGAVMGGLTKLASGGNLIVPSGLGIELGGRVQGPAGTITSNVISSGVLDPEGTGVTGGLLQVTGNLIMNPSGTVDMAIGGAPGSANYDRVNVSGTANFGGTMRVTLKNGYVPHVGEQFIAVNATQGRTGEFTNIIAPTPCNNVTFVMVYSSTAAIVLVRPPLGCTALGDLNSDGDHNGRDISVFVQNILNGTYDACADMNGDCADNVGDIPIFLSSLL